MSPCWLVNLFADDAPICKFGLCFQFDSLDICQVIVKQTSLIDFLHLCVC